MYNKKFDELQECLNASVKPSNGIDFVGVVNLEGIIDRKEPFLAKCSEQKPGVTIEKHKVCRIVETAASDWLVEPNNKYRVQEKENWSIAWMPVKELSSPEQAGKFDACFIMYISSMPQPTKTFISAIMHRAAQKMEATISYINEIIG